MTTASSHNRCRQIAAHGFARQFAATHQPSLQRLGRSE
jgi:hypothetical protein